MKIAIDTVSNVKLAYNASVKPRADVNKTLLSKGYEVKTLAIEKSSLPYLKRIKLFKSFLETIKGISKEDEVVIQYPFFFYNNLLETQAIKKLCGKCEHVTFIIHDVDSLRTGKKNFHELSLFNMPQRLIAHNDVMKAELERITDGVKIDTISLFDYYTSAKIITKDQLLTMIRYVAFAGNLTKSGFLRKLDSLPHNINWALYGIGGQAFDNGENINYCGKFEPDKPNILKAGWGLVWDGETIDENSDLRREYLCYNSPHKCSLYLSRGIPLIVWKKSALADFVEKEGIGIKIGSLSEVCDIIGAMSMTDYERIVDNAHRVGEKVRNGEFLKALI